MHSKTVEWLREAAMDLENLDLPKDAKFDMGTWGKHSLDHHPEEEGLCGTSACAAGWLSLEPKWRKRGFTSFWTDGVNEYGSKVYRIQGGTSEKWKEFPELGAEVFGVEKGEFYSIFMSTEASKDDVVDMFLRLADRYERRANLGTEEVVELV